MAKGYNTTLLKVYIKGLFRSYELYSLVFLRLQLNNLDFISRHEYRLAMINKAFHISGSKLLMRATIDTLTVDVD